MQSQSCGVKCENAMMQSTRESLPKKSISGNQSLKRKCKINNFLLAITQKFSYSNSMKDQKRFIELELGLSLSKAEGNLQFLASSAHAENTNIGITQGMAILDALNAVQKAREELQKILHKQRQNQTK